MLTTIKEEIDSNTIIVGDFNTQLPSMDESSIQKINKETQALNNTLDQTDLIDIQKQQNILSSHVHMGTFSRIDHILGHKWIPVN